MANQYCKITSWIEHNKKHGDPVYANAISELCLESSFNPTKYNGLTFLYQTDKSIRKKFSSGLFTNAARDMVNEVKRHILPDVFLSCEDFQTKDVGNLLKNKYEVKSCTKDTVTFANGMKIQAIEHNSFEPLSEQLKDVIRIYYIIEGEPPKDNKENYKIVYRKKSNKHPLAIEGGKTNKRLIRGGTAEEFEFVYANSRLGEVIKELSLESIKLRGKAALHIGLKFINNTLNPPQNSSYSENMQSSEDVSATQSHNKDIFDDNYMPPDNVVSDNNTTETKEPTLGGNELGVDNLKNLILAQWLVNSCEEGIIAYIYLCLFILYKSEPANDSFKVFINELITKMFEVISGGMPDIAVNNEEYFDELKSISSSLDFTISDPTPETQLKICDFIHRLKLANAPEGFIMQFFHRISNFKTIWGGMFVPTFFGDMREIIPIYGTYLGLWTLTLFSNSLEDVDSHGKLTMLDNEFCKLIRDSNNSDLDKSKLDIEYIFTEETLNKFLNKTNHTENPINNDFKESLDIVTNQESVSSPDNSNTTSGGMFD